MLSSEDMNAGADKPTSAERWYAGLPLPSLEGSLRGEFPARLRHFADTPPDIAQPALSDNVVAIHLGGPKRVRRWQSGRFAVWDVEQNSVTFMPACQRNRWLTEGPIDYAHLTLSIGLLGQAAREEFDRDPREVLLLDRVGQADPLIAELLLALLGTFRHPRSGRLFQECLLTALIVAVLERYSTLSSPGPGAIAAGSCKPAVRGGLAGWQLRRVVDYMAEHLSEDLGTAGLVSLTGLSRSQFFRAFRQSTGRSPHRYFTELRVEQAKQLLMREDAEPSAVASAVGFATPRHFAAAFKRKVGVAPKFFRCLQ